MQRLLDNLAAVDSARLVATLGSLVVLLAVGGWVVAVVNGSALGGQVAAAVAALLIVATALMYAFRLGTSSASE